MSKNFMNTRELAEYLSLTPTTIRAWRVKGEGPRFIKMSSRRVVYELKVVDAWLEKKRKASDVLFDEHKAEKAKGESDE